MATNSAIAWTKHTLNLWWGCVEVSPLCDNCYAREWAKRYDRAKWGAAEPRLYIKSGWHDVHKWQRDAGAAGRIDNVFCGSMMDIFEKPMPVVDGAGKPMNMTTGNLRSKMFVDIVPACPSLQFLFLTKRPGNIASMIPPEWVDEGAPSNVMFGTSVGTRDTIEAVDKLRYGAPGRKFLSIEPLLEDVGPFSLEGIDWVIVGCESLGKNAGRYAEGYEASARSIMEMCEKRGVAFFNKQMPIRGVVSHDPAGWPADLRVRQFPTSKEPSCK